MKIKISLLNRKILTICMFILFAGCFCYLVYVVYEDNIPIEDAENASLEMEEQILPDIQTDLDALSDPSASSAEGESEEKEEITENAEVLSLDPLSLCDLYAEKGTNAIFKCFYPNAAEYAWEYYDMTSKDWLPIENIQTGYDDLNRLISYVQIAALEENDGMMLRCCISFDNDMETITEIASLYVLDKDIVGVNIEEENKELDAEKYINIYDIPVKVKYEDGTEETIVGLVGLHFSDITESSEEKISSSGNIVEIITTVITEVDYMFPVMGENIVNFRYHPDATGTIDFSTIFLGVDRNPPVISQVDFSDYEVSTIDTPVTVTITIHAEDDITPYPNLQYAVLFKGQEPTEEDWTNKYQFSKEMRNNGTWVIYCRDQYGNVGFYEKDIIVIDNKPPEIVSVALQKEGWQSSNIICVDAKDALSLSYCFICAETGEDSGYIDRNEYEITHNGVWKIVIKDSAGNHSEDEITVSMIDNQSPVIIRIQEEVQ